MTWTLTSSAAAIAKAGVHANSAVVASAATLLKWCTDAEGFVCAQTHNDWVTNYASVSNLIKPALSDVVSSVIAMNIIQFDNTGFLAREADMLMNRNDDIISQNMKTLSIKQNQTLN